jgi:hypothetical protein
MPKLGANGNTYRDDTLVDSIYRHAVRDIWGLHKRSYRLDLDTARRQTFRAILKDYIHYSDEILIYPHSWDANIIIVIMSFLVNIPLFSHLQNRRPTELEPDLTAVRLTQVYRSEADLDFDQADQFGDSCVGTLAYAAAHTGWSVSLHILYTMLTGGLNVNSRDSQNRNAFHMALHGCTRRSGTLKWTNGGAVNRKFFPKRPPSY